MVETDQTHQVPVVPPTDTSFGPSGNEVLIMNTKNEDRPTSFFAQPGILAGKFIQSIHDCVFPFHMFILFFSCHWRSRRWIVVCYFSSHVHRISNEEKG